MPQTKSVYRVGIQTHGCRLNQSESEGIRSAFAAENNFEVVGINDNPDIAIINTCTVTARADHKNRNTIRSLIKKFPDSKVVVTGCYAQTAAEVLKQIPGIALVIGNDRKSEIVNLVKNYCHSEIDDFSTTSIPDNTTSRTLPVIKNPFTFDSSIPFNRTRSYLKIQEGCDRVCSYCKIPQARGAGVSRDSSDVLEQIRRLEAAGIPEIVLTGVNIGCYFDKFAQLNFADLLELILNNLSTSRLRISSLEPCDLNRKILELTQHPLLCNYLHLPIQSGSDRILKLMRRDYDLSSVRKTLEAVREFNSQIFIGTDLIVGFPGESDEDFQQSFALVQEFNLAGLHVFRYSERSKTQAATLKEKIVAPDELKNRAEKLKRLGQRLWRDYAEQFIGIELTAVIEREKRAGGSIALTDNYLKVEPHPDSKPWSYTGQLQRFRMESISDLSDRMVGLLLE